VTAHVLEFRKLPVQIEARGRKIDLDNSKLCGYRQKVQGRHSRIGAAAYFLLGTRTRVCVIRSCLFSPRTIRSATMPTPARRLRAEAMRDVANIAHRGRCKHLHPFLIEQVSSDPLGDQGGLQLRRRKLRQAQIPKRLDSWTHYLRPRFESDASCKKLI
jgi:hypothetical protein